MNVSSSAINPSRSLDHDRIVRLGSTVNEELRVGSDRICSSADFS